ncbi:unnamed protein product [Diatraea saccharalis]|uniref:Chitin-binding type-2 domain-containing protein n=1 Tax=Diatraea saccharalis TaxID=40085 RepID=A0A9N9R3A8_9NEOP|nr:unnamed protein product [Diatraea saccharalis]
MYWWSVVLAVVFQQLCVSSESHYECGAHGKFEYCVNRQPGCVVGCHCHPGYYFDTDTKICEHNLKLTQLRRHFDLEPTRVPIINYKSVTIPTFTTLSAVDEKVEAIAKDTDDLGDWLYNQFFKTIENQVINNTDNNVLNTRRSGNSDPVKPKRRSRKKSKKTKMKKKHTSIKKGLRSKLLRITEDDSLFDSSSRSSSESDSSSSESKSDSSDDHDHRKIVMINKKSTPSLPSFIFLPNVETPFYPPIGLPAPPIMPMYPMVPVPPMGFGYYTESTTVLSSTPSSSSTSQSIPSSSAPTETPSSTNVIITTIAPSTETTKTSDISETTTLINEETSDITEAPPESENPALRSRDLDNFDSPFFNMPAEKSSEREFYQPSVNYMAKPEDVDFKYLTELIHKIDLNKTGPRSLTNQIPLSVLTRKSNYQNSAPVYTNSENGITENYLPYYLQIPHKPRPISKADEMNDSYFTNLGKQIASLISNFNSNGEQQVNIELQRQNSPDNIQTANLLSENRFTQGRSYWERFVRSPLKSLLPFINKNNQEIQSNENLISIENQVNVATATRRPFSLQELENMANIAQQAIMKPKRVQYQPTKRTTNTNINNQYTVNLLPQLNRRINYPVTLANAEIDGNPVVFFTDNLIPIS